MPRQSSGGRSSRRRSRARIARATVLTAAAPFVVLAMGVPPAQAAYACTVSGTSPDQSLSLTLQAAADETYTITRSAGGVLQVNGDGCTGDPLVADLGAVNVQGQAGRNQTLVVSQAGGALENSLGTDVAFTVDMGDGTDTVRIVTTDAADTIRLGAPGAVQTVDFGNDAGSANMPSASNVEQYDVVAGGGNDDIGAAGGGDVGAVGAVDVPVSVAGGDGNDTVTGGSAADTLSGAVGDDTVTGGSGNDLLVGDDGLDSLSGGDGDDILRGGGGDDTISGGAHSQGDTLDFSGAEAGVTVNLLTARAEGSAAATGTDGFAGIEIVSGSPENDVFVGNAGDNVFDGGGGSDTVDYSLATSPVTATLPTPGVSATASGAGVGTDTLRNMANLIGSPFADTITGSAAPNTINGGAGDDTVIGGDEAPAALVSGGRLILPGTPGNYASSPDSAALTGGGGLELRAKLAMADWTPPSRQFIVSKTRDFISSTTGSYGLAVEPWGGLTFVWFEDTFGGGSISVNSNVLPSAQFTAGSTHWVRVRYTENLAASQRDIAFSFCTENPAAPVPAETCDDASEFTGAGNVGGFLFGSGLRDGSDELRIGDLAGTEMLTGDVHRLQVLSTGATTLFDADFGVVPDHASSFTESSTNGASVTVHSLRGDVLSGDAGDDAVVGGLGYDVVDGGAGNDTVRGDRLDNSTSGLNYGEDTVAGGAGLDLVEGGPRDDVLKGNDDDDTITGGDGDDTMNGGGGDDRLIGGAGDDAMDGAVGAADLADYSTDVGPVVVDLAAGTATGAGSDTLANLENATGSPAGDTLTGDDGNNRLTGLGGDDALAGLDGDDALTGGAGADRVDYSSAPSGVTVDLSTTGAPQNTESAGLDTITTVESVTGSPYADTLTGNGLPNTISGAAGNDTVAGGAGDDSLQGGADRDTASFSGSSGPVSMSLLTGTASGEGSDLLSDIEDLVGSAFDDTVAVRDGTVNDVSCGPGTDSAEADVDDSIASDCESVDLPEPPDTVPPTAVNVTSSKPDGAYVAGAVIPVQVVFSEPVFVTGTPRMTLETGAADAVVSYVSGSGSDSLTFTYTVVAGDNATDLDYVAGSLELNGGTIRDAADLDADLALPAPGAPGSLGANKALVIDTTAPESSIVAGPAGATNDATPTFSFSADEAGSTFECRLDSSAFAGCSSPFTAGPLADGAHTFQVRATDPAGNVATPASRAFTVDTDAPDTSITAGPSGTVGDSTPTFTFASEAGSTFECRVDGDAFTPCTSPFTTTVLADGAHTFDVRGIDPSGNVDPAPASRAFTVDTSAPITWITSGPSGSTNDATPTFDFGSDDPGSSFECRIDAGAFSPCSSPFTSGTLADGAHTFRVRAIDASDNVDTTPATWEFTVDTDAPETSITSGPTGTTSDPTATFEFGADEDGSTFECRIDAASFAPCSSPFTTVALADGAHTFAVRAVDPAGNTDPGPAVAEFVVDVSNLPPTLGVSPLRCSAGGGAAWALAVDDADGGPGAMVVDATSSNQDLVRDRDLVVRGTGFDRTLRITPITGESGSAVVTVTASDGSAEVVREIRVQVGTDGPDDLRLGGLGMALGGPGEDVLLGSTRRDVLCGGDGADLLESGDALDVLNGGRGKDRLQSGAGADRLQGGPATDLVRGGTGGDFVKGGVGHDLLFGGQGDDRLRGGLGADRFDGGPGVDLLLDFTAAQGDTKR